MWEWWISYVGDDEDKPDVGIGRAGSRAERHANEISRSREAGTIKRKSMTVDPWTRMPQ